MLSKNLTDLNYKTAIFDIDTLNIMWLLSFLKKVTLFSC